MKVVADVSERGEIPWYLTANKEYSVKTGDASGGFIESDDGNLILCNFKRSSHLNGGSWRIVEE